MKLLAVALLSVAASSSSAFAYEVPAWGKDITPERIAEMKKLSPEKLATITFQEAAALYENLSPGNRPDGEYMVRVLNPQIKDPYWLNPAHGPYPPLKTAFYAKYSSQWTERSFDAESSQVMARPDSKMEVSTYTCDTQTEEWSFRADNLFAEHVESNSETMHMVRPGIYLSLIYSNGHLHMLSVDKRVLAGKSIPLEAESCIGDWKQ